MARPADIDWDQLEDHTPPMTYRPDIDGPWIDGTRILDRESEWVYVDGRYL